MRIKFWNVIFCWLCVICLLTACSDVKPEGSASNVHNHVQWERDVKEHWVLNEDGEKTNVGQHTVEEFVCTVCGSEIWVFEDGSAEISNYNEQGEWVRLTSLDADGAVISEIVFDYVYDANGKKLEQSQYQDGFMVEKITYQIGADGESVPFKQVGFDQDGSRSENLYDENGNVIKLSGYDPHGNLLVEESKEYAKGDDGVYYEMRSTTVWDDGSKQLLEYNPYGDKTLWVAYDIFGNEQSHHESTYEYDSEGNRLGDQLYIDGVLTYATQYALDADGYSYIVKETEYREDGSYIVYEFDADGEMTAEIIYDSEGNVMEE